MKKFGVVFVLAAVLLLSGCDQVNTKNEEKGNYKEGTYFASVAENYNGKITTATAVIYVGEDGHIKSVFLDTAYPGKDETTGEVVYSTKKALGDNYGMKKASPEGKEWDEQVILLEKAIVEKDGLDFIEWKDEDKTTTDSVAGVTFKINAIYKAANEALTKAKK